ncbi:MAG: thioredoxin family protein [Deltaproteobacteria bacterium]|nr:thioredoxin family protein [Deltaproteobacteria bacterium]
MAFRPAFDSSRRGPGGFLAACALLAALALFATLPAQAAQPLEFLGLKEALAKSKAEGKFTVLYFWTSSCPYCRYLDAEVLTDPGVVGDLNQSFVMVSLDKDRERELASRFRVNSVPRLIFLDSQGEPATVLPGAAEPALFRLFLAFVATNTYRDMEFDEFFDLVLEK